MGVLGLVSLVVPLEVYWSSNYFGFDWTILGVTISGFQYGQRLQTFFYYLTEYSQFYQVLESLIFILVLVGAILLLFRRSPKAGASLLLVGFLLYFANFVYGLLTSPFVFDFLPVSPIIVLVAAIVGFRAQAPMPHVAAPVETVPVDQLLKLKALLDSGAITKEEFEEQKRKILGS